MIAVSNAVNASTSYVIQNRQTKEIWSPDDLSQDMLFVFQNIMEANTVLNNLDVDKWELKRVGLFGLDNDRSPIDKLQYNPPEGSVASKIKVGRGEHVLVCGEVQIGKLKEKLELTVHLRENHRVPVLVLFRNNNVDYHQFTKRLDEFNDEQRKAGKPTIPQPFDILSYKDRLAQLLKDTNVILGLANPETMAIVERCMDEHPDLQGKLVIVMDEADLVTFELEGDNLRTKTENNLLSLFDKIYMLVSVTGTPGSILLCDEMTQVFVIDRPNNYYGIDRIKHITLQPVRANKKHQQYNPELDKDNLESIMSDILSLPKATLLILVSRLRREHKDVINYLSDEYGHLGSDVVYLELNEKSVKVYDHNGTNMNCDIDCKTFKGTKVGPIDVAIQKYINTKYVIIVAGVLAGRGVSFVSQDYKRHLTHQYIAAPEGCHLESAMQSVRLLGKYNDNPNLTLYCSEPLYQDLFSQCEDMKAFVELAIEARENKNKMPNLIAAQKEYTHKWFPPRKQKGISFEMKKTSTYTLECFDYDPRLHKDQFQIDHILTNMAYNYPAYIMNGKWPSFYCQGGHAANKEFLVYCNRLSDFTPEGILRHKEKFKVNPKVLEELLSTGYRHMDSLKKLYSERPQLEGKFLRRIEKGENKVHTFARR